MQRAFVDGHAGNVRRVAETLMQATREREPGAEVRLAYKQLVHDVAEDLVSNNPHWTSVLTNEQAREDVVKILDAAYRHSTGHEFAAGIIKEYCILDDLSVSQRVEKLREFASSGTAMIRFSIAFSGDPSDLSLAIVKGSERAGAMALLLRGAVREMEQKPWKARRTSLIDGYVKILENMTRDSETLGTIGGMLGRGLEMEDRMDI